MKRARALEKDNAQQPRAGRISRASSPAVVTKRGPENVPVPKRKVIGLLPEHLPDADARIISFAYFDPGAEEVFLAGSFNDWQRGSLPLTKQRDGRWSTELLLRPGSYEYRYIVDGEWKDDPMAAHSVANVFGSLNSVVQISSLAAGDGEGRQWA